MEQDKELKLGTGLQELKEDERDFSHSAVFGMASLEELPDSDFFVAEPLEIKNQDINYFSDYCAAYAASAVSEDQEACELVPEYTFAKAKMLVAEDRGVEDEESRLGVIQEFGLSLRDICRAGCKFGFLERTYDPHHCDTVNRPDRAFLGDWKNWPEDLDMLAFDHRKNSFFKVDGPYDFFDNIRATLWKNRNEYRSVITGAKWRADWTNIKDGILDINKYSQDSYGFGHAFKIFGQMRINNEIYLVAQLSNGQYVGDKGLYYFSREVVNKEIAKYGAFTFRDMPKEKAKTYMDLGVPENAAMLVKLIALIKYFIKSLKK